jgi:DNA-binding transcriptional regulator LsrR (DeoR family)
MSDTIHSIHDLAQQSRAFSPSLLSSIDDPHAEMLAMVWGPRFDREHALGLWAQLSQRFPLEAAPVLPALLAAADRFDALGRTAQQRLRQLILRHRALGDAAAV